MGMARCTLCVCDFSCGVGWAHRCASGGRTDVRLVGAPMCVGWAHRCASGGRTDVRRHVEKMLETMVATKGSMGHYVAKRNNATDGVTKAKTTVAYWLTYHNLPMSEFSKMVLAMFPDSKIAKTYSSGKCYKTVCNNVLSLGQICYIVIVM